MAALAGLVAGFGYEMAKLGRSSAALAARAELPMEFVRRRPGEIAFRRPA